MGEIFTYFFDIGLNGRLGLGIPINQNEGIQGTSFIGGHLTIRPLFQSKSIELGEHWYAYPEIFARLGASGGLGVETGLRYSFFQNVGFSESLQNWVTLNREYGIEAYYRHQSKDGDGEHWNHLPRNLFSLGTYVGLGSVIYHHAENPIAAYLGLDYATEFNSYHEVIFSLKWKLDFSAIISGFEVSE
jgi:hypothetical protein